ncbi:MAG: peptide chain release factor 1 [Deltaproteobacteria bacterium]|nr:peptide chain release factor 1 [Deltaproteobacteria bacterium]
MYEKLNEVVQRFEDLSNQLLDPAVFSDRKRYAQIAKERAGLEPVVTTYRRFKDVVRQIEDSEQLLEDSDPEIRDLAHQELLTLRQRRDELDAHLEVLLLPKDPRDDKNIIVEIRAGTGGEEAALFVGDLFRMYTRFAETQAWKVEILSAHETELRGFKEVVAMISGKQVFSRLKYESGVHRVQRVPETEAQGRIHTSAVTVAVLPEAEEVEVEVREEDLKIDTYRSSGAGGQHVNVTDSAIRITHIPTGVVVTCQDERSQFKNKAKAMKILRAKLLEAEREAQEREERETRRSQVGSGDRSERIRTYNFPQNRLTDHRVGLTIYQLDRIMEGEIDDMLSQVRAWFQAEELKAGRGE